MTDPTKRPAPQIPAIVQALAGHRVRWIMTGSAVLTTYGADLSPNDLDVTPELSAGNLERLARLLGRIDARPAYEPTWAPGPTLTECEAWRPEPAVEHQLDHLLVTQLGMVDIVPRLCGTFEDLAARASLVRVAGSEVLICDPADVLARLVGRDRAKDRRRRAVYADLERRLADGGAVLDAARLG